MTTDVGDTTFAELRTLQAKLAIEYKNPSFIAHEVISDRPDSRAFVSANSHSTTDLHYPDPRQVMVAQTVHISEQSVDVPQKPIVSDDKSKLLMMSGDVDDVVFDQAAEQDDSGSFEQ